jgi:hypothetical protein
MSDNEESDYEPSSRKPKGGAGELKEVKLGSQQLGSAST